MLAEYFGDLFVGWRGSFESKGLVLPVQRRLQRGAVAHKLGIVIGYSGFWLRLLGTSGSNSGIQNHFSQMCWFASRSTERFDQGSGMNGPRRSGNQEMATDTWAITYRSYTQL